MPLCCSSFKYGIDICMKLAWCFLNMHKLCGLRPETEVKCCFCCCCQTMTWPSDCSRFSSISISSGSTCISKQISLSTIFYFLMHMPFSQQQQQLLFLLLFVVVVVHFWLTSSSCLCFQATMSWHLHFSLPGQAAKTKWKTVYKAWEASFHLLKAQNNVNRRPKLTCNRANFKCKKEIWFFQLFRNIYGY